jgi:hypothetical protein
MHYLKDPACGRAHRRAKEVSNRTEPVEGHLNDAHAIDVEFANADSPSYSSSPPILSSPSSTSDKSTPLNNTKEKGVFINRKKRTSRPKVFKEEWNKYMDSDKSSSSPVEKRKESPESTYSSTYKLKKNSSTRIPPVIEFDKLSFRNAPQPKLTHDGPYGGSLKIGPPGQE